MAKKLEKAYAVQVIVSSNILKRDITKCNIHIMNTLYRSWGLNLNLKGLNWKVVAKTPSRSQRAEHYVREGTVTGGWLPVGGRDPRGRIVSRFELKTWSLPN